MRCYDTCDGCGVEQWDGEYISLTIEDDDDEPTEMTFHSRACLLDWLTRDRAEEEAAVDPDDL